MWTKPKSKVNGNLLYSMMLEYQCKSNIVRSLGSYKIFNFNSGQEIRQLKILNIFKANFNKNFWKILTNYKTLKLPVLFKKNCFMVNVLKGR